MTRARAIAPFFALIPVLGACYATVAVDPARAAAGDRLTLTLSPAGAASMAPALGAGVARAEGALTRATPQTVELSLARTQRLDGVDALWQGQRVLFPREAVAATERRRLSRGRTWVLAGSVALVAGMLARSLGSTGGQPAPGEPPPLPAH